MIREKIYSDEIIVDLTGPQGNAHYLLSLAQNLARKSGIDVKPLLQEMKSGDYENLLQVFDKHFGEFVILERQ